MRTTIKIFLFCFVYLWMVTFSKGNVVYEEAINRFNDNPSKDNIIQLAGHLRGIARYRKDYKNSEYYIRIQNLLLATPGHARYFAEEVERLIADPANAGVSVRERSWYLGHTLVHLPSPETIQVLGSYLYDERYTLDPTKDNSGALGPTYRIVARSIRNIGLREPQDVIRTEGVPWTTDNDIESIRRWWEEVKTGKRAFSFKGQSVEYRFLPDGTWETIPMENPPDDDPRKVVAVAATPQQKDEPSPTQPPAPEARDMPRPLMWIGLAGALLALAAGWRMLRRKSHS